jgi:hypothetical protein
LAQFGLEASQYDLFGIEVPTTYTVYSGQCASKSTDSPFFPYLVPPFAQYQGIVQVNGRSCQRWNANFAGQFSLDLYVYNETDQSSGKITPLLAAVEISSPMLPGPIKQEFQQYFLVGTLPDEIFQLPASCTPPPPPPTFRVSGYTKNAVNNRPVPSTNVKLTNSNGQVIANTQSDSQGLFTISGVLTGQYTLSGMASGFSPSQSSIDVQQDIGAGGAADLVLSPQLPANQWRAVLTWGAQPRDLDSHTLTPSGCEVYFSHRVCGGVSLDVDATQGFGPETTTFIDAASGTYQFRVFIYAGLSVPALACRSTAATVGSWTCRCPPVAIQAVRDGGTCSIWSTVSWLPSTRSHRRTGLTLAAGETCFPLVCFCCAHKEAALARSMSLFGVGGRSASYLGSVWRSKEGGIRVFGIGFHCLKEWCWLGISDPFFRLFFSG